MDSKKIVWSPSTIEELRRALGEVDRDEEFEEQEGSDLDFPWPITVVKQEVSTSDSGDQVINATLGFTDVEGADDYEVRISLVPEIVSFWDGMSAFTSWPRNNNATLISGGTEVQLHSSSSLIEGSIVSPEFVPSDWSVIDITVRLNISGGGDGWQVILWDAATHGTTELSAVGTRFSAVIDGLWPGDNTTGFTSNNGTTAVGNNSVSGSFGQTGPTDYDYRFVWTKVSANSAGVQVFRNGALVKTSANNLWVPDTARVGIWGVNGLLSGNVKVIKAVTVLASG